MWRKIKRFFYNLFYSLPFGLKAADELLSTQTINDDVGVVETIRQNRLSEGLIKGEVTQQVEELRYRDYKVYRESKKYKYLGDGIAIKKDIRNRSGKLKFTQENKLITNTVLDELKRVDNKTYSKEEYTLNIHYKETVRFPLEKYCKKFEFCSNNSPYDSSAYMSFTFSKEIDSNNPYSKHFIDFLNEMIKNGNGYGRCNEYNDNIDFISFTTYKADMEDDYVNYIVKNAYGGQLSEYDGEYHMYFFFQSFERVDLTDKFYNESLEKKYQNKEKKENNFTFGNIKRITTCDKCGKEISNYDSDITRGTFGISMCSKCLEKYLEEEYNENRDRIK